MLPPWRVIGFVAAFLVAVAAGTQSARADYTQGAACSVKAGGPIANSANDDGNNLVCISGTWQYPVYVLQSAAASANSSCSGYPAGAVRYNTTLTNTEFCNGTIWQQVPAYSSSCGSPSGLSFTNVTNATLSTSYTSNTATITFSGCSSPLSVSVSGAATAQISVNGGTWTTSGAILSGQTLQVRLTSSGSVSTGLTATVTVGASSTNWTVTTRSAALQVFTTTNLYTASGFGGLSGADTICQSEANTAGYAGTYKAILSDDSTSAASRLTLSYPVANAYNGSTVSASNLWNGTISTQILTPAGTNSTGNGNWVFSGTNADGSAATGSTCSNWTTTAGFNNMRGASNSSSNSSGQWIAQSSSTACNLALPFYCIQQ
jgi:hypothetical protein